MDIPHLPPICPLERCPAGTETETKEMLPHHLTKSTPKAPKKEAPVGNGGVMTGNTALVPNLLAMAFRFRQRKVPSGTSIYHTRTPCQRQNQNSQSRRVSTARAVGLAPAIPSTPAKGGRNKKGAR